MVKNFNEQDYDEYKNNFDTLKYIFETFTGTMSTLYPYINSLYDYIKDKYKEKPTELNSKFLYISSQNLGDVFDYFKKYDEALKAYTEAFFLNGNLDLILKILMIQILQLKKNNRKMAIIANRKFSEISKEIHHINFFTINDQILQPSIATEYFQSFLNLSNNLLNFTEPAMKKKQQKPIIKKINLTIKTLMNKGINLNIFNNELKKLFLNLE